MKRWICLIYACIALLACQPDAKQDCTGVVTRFRALAYSRSFAARFELPVQAALELDPGLQAMAIRVDDDSSRNAMCSLDLYLDDAIALDYPEGSEGRSADLRAESGPLFFVSKLNDADVTATSHRWLQERMAYR